MSGATGTVVIGLGNEYRRDDGFGPAVARALHGRLPTTIPVTVAADAADLLDGWAAKRLAIVVDLVLMPRPAPGRVHRWIVGDAPGPLGGHGIDVAATLALARVLGTAPGRVVLYAAESSEVGFGTDLSPAVRHAVAVTARAIAAEVTGDGSPYAGQRVSRTSR